MQGGIVQARAQSGCRSIHSGPFAEDGGTWRVENSAVGGSCEREHRLSQVGVSGVRRSADAMPEGVVRNSLGHGRLAGLQERRR